jgi:hypothetical protein
MKTYLLARTCDRLVKMGFHVVIIHDAEVSIQPLTVKGLEALRSMLSTDAQLRTAIPLQASPSVVASLLVNDCGLQPSEVGYLVWGEVTPLGDY